MPVSSNVRPHREPSVYSGEPVNGIAFYELLFQSEKFCAEMGRVGLASSQLEAELILVLKKKGVPQKVDGQPLGVLVRLARKHLALSASILSAVDDLCSQRNYLTHNIYALFIGLIEETRLERSNLIDTDVETYIERAWQLRENLVGLAEVVALSLKDNSSNGQSAA